MNFNIKSCFDGDDDECLSKNVKICGQRHAFFMLQTITYMEPEWMMEFEKWKTCPKH